MTVRFLCLAVLLFVVQIGRGDGDAWTARETIQTDALVKLLPGGPRLLMAGPRILYNGAHISGAIYAGPAGKAEGVDNLTQAVAPVAKGQPIVLYCGCCPMEKCPNIRPAFQKLKELGYSDVKVLILPTNLHDDWIAKGYPVEKGDVLH